ncbi:MAG: DNA repair protein RadC [Myxococcota bacterium]|jgi:DNA repair protein RadC|nr:DNA repair protein RadC [Myxococcota bacterium]
MANPLDTACAGEARALDTLGGEDRPRERLTRDGASALSDAEVLALLFRTGGAGHDALALARDLLARTSGLRGLLPFDPGEHADTPGLGPAKLASLAAAIELGRRLQVRRLEAGARIENPASIYRHFHPRLRDCEHERFLAVLLDSRHCVVGERLISQGTLTASLVHPREVFRPALRASAAAIVVVHNHPSGDPAPSTEDREVTRRLERAGRLIGVRVLDHVVVAERGYFSFRESGEMESDPLGGGQSVS